MRNEQKSRSKFFLKNGKIYDGSGAAAYIGDVLVEDDKIIRQFEHDPRCLYMTDAWVEDHGVQNPAVYDCFPKFLRDSVLGVGDTLPNTINRMTGATAERFGLRQRGYIRPGHFADLTVFSEDELAQAFPDQERSFGIRKVWINGRLVLDGSELNAEVAKTCGRAIFV